MDFAMRYIWQINKNGLVYLANRLKKFNIGSGQLPLLMLLYHKDSLNQEELSRLLNMDKGATTKAVIKLLKEKYIERKTDPVDKRMYRIFLTSKAFKIKDQLENIAEDWQKIILNGFPKKDKNSILEILEKMTDNSIKYKRN
jgi:DNA-binding MarR family transcriptional regulator